MSASTIPATLSPYDTGARLDPKVWPVNGDSDRYGRVDFDDDEGATQFTAYGERRSEGSYALHVELNAGAANTAVFVDEVLYVPGQLRADYGSSPTAAAVAKLMALGPEVLAEAVVRSLAVAGAQLAWDDETVADVLDELQRSTRSVLPSVEDTDYWTPVAVEALLADAHEAQAAMAEEEN